MHLDTCAILVSIPWLVVLTQRLLVCSVNASYNHLIDRAYYSPNAREAIDRQGAP